MPLRVEAVAWTLLPLRAAVVMVVLLRRAAVELLAAAATVRRRCWSHGVVSFFTTLVGAAMRPRVAAATLALLIPRAAVAVVALRRAAMETLVEASCAAWTMRWSPRGQLGTRMTSWTVGSWTR